MFSKEITEKKEKLDHLFNDIRKRLIALKKRYKDFHIDSNNPLSVIGLDTLTFQSNMMELEYKNLQKYKLMVLNRMYCENYKIHKIIAREQGGRTMFPPYKDLEQYKEYSFTDIINMNKNIKMYIDVYKTRLSSAITQVKQLHELTNKGYNINNYVSSVEYDVDVLSSKINLYEKYMTFLNKSYSTNIDYLITRSTTLLDEINKNVIFQDSDLEDEVDDISVLTSTSIGSEIQVMPIINEIPDDKSVSTTKEVSDCIENVINNIENQDE